MPSPQTPKVTLYDFGAIEDPTVRSLTLFVCVAEVIRQVMRPENRGRPGVLLVDEAGVLLSQPGEAGAELVRFVQTAWKTFRKLGVSCIGSTNEPADYAEKAGPRTIWFNSPTKVFLRLKPDNLKLARIEDRAKGRPAPDRGSAPRRARDESPKGRRGLQPKGMWVSDETRGTFTYVPNGYDTWLAASKPLEVRTPRRRQHPRLPAGGAPLARRAVAERGPRPRRSDPGAASGRGGLVRTMIWIQGGRSPARPGPTRRSSTRAVDTSDDDDLVADSGATNTAAVPDAQLHASGVPPAMSPPPGQPPLCLSQSPRCLAFATTSALAKPPWDGLWLRRDVSGPAGIWRKKGKR